MARNIVRQRRGWVFEGGIANKGGVWAYSGSGAPVNGSAGTGAAEAAPGSRYYDFTNGIYWFNVGTMAAPVWTPLSPVSFAVSSANILAMNGTPVNLIAAPPAGYVILVDNVVITMIRTATAYANGGAVNLQYSGAASAHTGTLPASVVTTGGAGTAITQLGPATGANGTTIPTATGIDITNATAAFITGTGTMKVNIDYRVVAQ